MALFGSRLAKLAQFLATGGTVPETAISTAETDTDLRLAPDGAGGVEWGTGGAGGGGLDVSARMELYDECYFVTAGQFYHGGVFGFTSGAGATSAAVNSVIDHPGIIQHPTGSTAAGRSGLFGGSVILGGGEFTFGNIFRIVTLSDATDTFHIRFGLHDSVVTADPARGVYFRYNDAVNGGRWEAVTRNGGGGASETAVDTGIAADTSWHRFEYVINAGATSVEFFIDGASVATITTNIPALLVQFIPSGIFKTLSGVNRTCQIDAYWYRQTFTTPR